MERISPDIYGALPSPRDITSTFKIDIGRYRRGDVLQSDACGLGWKFALSESQESVTSGLYSTRMTRAIRVYFEPGLLSIDALHGVSILVRTTPDCKTIESPKIIWPRYNGNNRDKVPISRYHFGTYDLGDLPGSSVTISFSVSLPNVSEADFPVNRAAQNIPAPSVPHPNSKLHDLLHKTLQGSTRFDDALFVLFSRRVPGRKVGAPEVLYANYKLLAGCNDYLDNRMPPNITWIYRWNTDP